MQDLTQQQIELEKEYTSRGVTKSLESFRTSFEKDRLSDTYAGRFLMLKLYDGVKEELDKLLELNNAKTRLIKTVGADVCTVIALRCMLSNIPYMKIQRQDTYKSSTRMHSTATDVVMDIGKSIETEWLSAYVRSLSDRYHDVMLKGMDEANTSHETHRKSQFRTALRNMKLEDEQILWSGKQRSEVGVILLKALTYSGTCDLEVIQNGKQKLRIVKVSPVILNKLEFLSDNLKAHSYYPPMLVKPVKHTVETVLDGSSYLTEDMWSSSPSVVLRTRSEERKNWFKKNISQFTLDSMNLAQEVAYKFDSEVFSKVMEAARTSGHQEIAGLPASIEITPPEYPLEEGWDRDDERLTDIHKDWKAEAKEAYAAEIKRKSKVLQFSECAKYIKQFEGKEVYFPTFKCWRGRTYYRPRVSPQSNDPVKACIKLANPRKLGSTGLYWLKFTVASYYGYDSAHPDLRVKWCDDNLEAIKYAVQDTIDNEWFLQADKHWCFYAASKALLEALSLPKPEEYVCDVVGYIDATCSGTQILSGIGLDEVGGKYVNLTKTTSDTKADIYKACAEYAQEYIDGIVDSEVVKQYWKLNPITRGMSKKPCMTLVYNATLISSAEYVRKSMKDEGYEGIEDYSLFKLSIQAAKAIRKALRTIVPNAVEQLEFMKVLARSVPEDCCLRIVTLDGFPVLNEYSQMNTSVIRCKGIGSTLTFAEFDEELINRSKSADGISPNTIHSQDGSLLTYTINAFNDDIAAIHDSVGTHMCELGRLNDVIRERFVFILNNYDAIQELTDYANRFIDINTDNRKLNKSKYFVKGVGFVPPSKGNLDLNEVLDNPYFFS